MRLLTEQNIHDLQQVNWLAKADWRKKNLCYAVKDAIISRFGTHRGFVCQQFERKTWEDQLLDWGDIFSIHKHILEVIEVGGKTFHKPTNEFSYEDACGHKKHSPEFSFFYEQCEMEPLIGILKPPADFNEKSATHALRRLVHDHYDLLRAWIKKPERTLYPFIHAYPAYPSSSSFQFIFRVPESVTVCSGCGRKVQVRLDSYDLDPSRTEFGLFGPNPTRGLRIECDASYAKDRNCQEYVAVRKFEWGNLVDGPYQNERVQVAAWLIGVIPEYNEWRRSQDALVGKLRGKV